MKNILASKELNEVMVEYGVKYIVVTEEGYEKLKGEHPEPKGYQCFGLNCARIINEKELRHEKKD